jgi:plasmid maintenance system killer protein
LIILYADKRLEKEFNDHRLLVKRHGAIQAKRIEQRLSDLSAAQNLEVMRSLPGRCHELTGNLKGYLALDLVHPQRLIIEAANEPAPSRPDGGLDWSLVTEIRIIRIEDYHG